MNRDQQQTEVRECYLSSGAVFRFPVCYPKILRSRYTRLILPVLYGCEAWPLTLREEQRLRVFVNRVLRKIFGHK